MDAPGNRQVLRSARDPGRRTAIAVAHAAIQAANRLAAAFCNYDQRLAALAQLHRHVDGLMAKVKADAGNPPARDTGD